MNSEENNEVKRQLKAMEMNILSLNNNSIQSNTGSDEDPTTNSLNSTNSSAKDNGQHDDNNSNHSNQSLDNLNARRGSSRRRKSVPYKVSTANKASETATTTSMIDQIETEEDDILSSRSDHSPSVKDEDSNGSNIDEQMNE